MNNINNKLRDDAQWQEIQNGARGRTIPGMSDQPKATGIGRLTAHWHRDGARVLDSAGGVVAICDGVEIAKRIVRERAAHDALVEALERLTDSAQDTWASGRPEASMDSAIDAARAALALARGEG